jgi:two-component system, chemotaxis family, protein-glutamate methylesterase/glutaminase
MDLEARRDVIVVGASAGGVEALRALVAGLPPDLPAVVLVVLHVARLTPSALPTILRRAGPLPVAHAEDDVEPRPGHIYVAPPDQHLLLVQGRLRLTHGPTENGHRPAIDPLFRSAARSRGPGVIGVILSGARDDGAAGLLAIAERGGGAIVQDPHDALHPSMPLRALELVPTAAVQPAGKIGALLGDMAREPFTDPPPRGRPGSNALADAEVGMAEMKPTTNDELPAEPAGFGCPNCGGSLFELPNGPTPRYRCRVGYAWTAAGLLEEQANALESALWMALRALEAKATLSRRMADARVAVDAVAARFRSAADEAQRAGLVIRDLIGTIAAVGAAAGADHEDPAGGVQA